MIKRIILIGLLFQAFQSLASEYIDAFHSNIEVKVSGDIYVTETITVHVENDKIKRGIYRDFPTMYKTALLTKSTVDFVVLSVKRNGANEPHHTENLSHGVRLYVGSRSQLVSRGKQVYEIRYLTNKQIAFMEDRDRFAWNITGNDWQFKMNHVSAEVHLPQGVSMSMVNSGVWTGFAGETNADYRSEIKDNVFTITNTKPLEPYQGMTFSLEFPSGFINNDGNWFLDFLSDNLMWILMLIVLLSLLMFYLLAWHQVGRDPEKGIIVPLFYPPNDISPAAMRYIVEEKSNHKNFTAALINLAVKGYVKLKKTQDGYKVSQIEVGNKKLRPASSGEHIILKRLFSGSRKNVYIDKQYDSKIKSAIKQVNERLKSEYKTKCFKDNKMLGYFGMGISFLVLVLFMLHLNLLTIEVMGAMFIPLAFTAFALFILFKANKGLWDSLVVITHGLLMVVAFISSSGGLPKEVVFMTVFLVVINGFFIYLLKSPTPFGRELMDKIEGFKLYLSTAEQHRLDIMHPPEMTPVLFEQYLPYAMALGVENQWSERFANYLKSAGTDNNHYNYSPNWYSGGHFNLSGSSSSFSDFNRGMANTISAASVPPSSSSGGFSSGGGFSGGGGGGGGGGGW